MRILTMVGLAAASHVDIAALATKARTDFWALREDAFASRTLNDDLAGRSFSITVSPTNGDRTTPDVSNGSYYSYNNGILTVRLSGSQVKSSDDNKQSTYSQIIPFSVINKVVEVSDGVNGYGARVKFVTRSIRESGIYPVGGLDRTNFEFSEKIEGAAAKALALSAKFEIRGTVERLPSGHIGACSTDYVGATVDSPVELATVSCWIGAKIDSVALVSPSGTLRSWKAPSSS